MPVLVAVEELTKSYGALPALSGVSFTIDAGEIVALLGPNGAGKSTALGILATLLPFDAGTVSVGGHRLPAGAAAARRALGLVPQLTAVYPTLTARENLQFFARGLGLSARAASAAADDTLTLLGLTDRADEPVARFSVGMRRRLNLGCGIIHRPSVLLLDEPTVGVDPQSRERVFDTVQGLADAGAAVLLSTHYMEEAARLCRRVVLLDRGRMVASGTPAELVSGLGMTPRLTLRTQRPLPPGWLADAGRGRVLATDDGTTTVALADTGAVAAVLAAAEVAGGEVLDLALHQPTLADAFFALTGRELRDETEAVSTA